MVPEYHIMIAVKRHDVTEVEVHLSECGSEEDEKLSVPTLESSLPSNTVP